MAPSNGIAPDRESARLSSLDLLLSALCSRRVMPGVGLLAFREGSLESQDSNFNSLINRCLLLLGKRPIALPVLAPILNFFMNDNTELDEFYEDFGTPPLSASELDTILERARLASDSQLRQLVKEVQLQRWLLPKLLERAEQARNDSEDQVMKLARFFIRGAGAIGGA